ncbi:MAG TPA: DUF6587 family protein [Burkholderiaceae bacterium]
MIQEIVVGLIVSVAALAVLRRYAPNSLKRTARIAMVRIARMFGWNALADKLGQQAEAGASCGDGCGSCGSCGPSSNEKSGPVQSVSVEDLKQTLRR